jgi:hypothetical protein
LAVASDAFKKAKVPLRRPLPRTVEDVADANFVIANCVDENVRRSGNDELSGERDTPSPAKFWMIQ